MPCDLIFIDQKEDIALLKDLVNEDIKVICLQPNLRLELEQIDIPYENSTNFFGAEGHQSTLLLSDEIIEKIRPLLNNLFHGDFLKTFEINWIFNFRFHLHYWISITFIIHKAVEKYQPHSLIILGSSAHELIQKKENRSSLLSSIVKHYGETKGIKIHFIKHLRRTRNKNWKGLVLFKRYLKIIIFEFLMLIYPLVSHKKTSILVPDDSYGMPNFLSKLSQHIDGFWPVYLQSRRANLGSTILKMKKRNLFSFITIPGGFNSHKNNIFQDKLNLTNENIITWFNDPLNSASINGVDLSRPLSRFISDELTNEIKELHGKLISLCRVLNIVQPQYVFAQHSLGISYALGEYCARNSVPSLLISHGSHVPHTGSIAELEWSIHAHTIINSAYPLVALQTPWATKFFEEQEGVASHGIETGPLLLSKMSDINNYNYRSKDQLFKDHKDRKILLHASTPRDWKNFRPWVYETTDEYIRNINDIIQAVEANKNLYLAIRFRSQKNLSLSKFRSLLISSNCYEIYTDGSFEEYLLSSDLLISYSSTTIEESLQNQIPVIQYDPDGKYIHVPGQKLSEKSKKNISSVYYVHSQNYLSESLKWWDMNHDNKKVNDWSNHIFEIEDQMSWIDLLY